MDAVRREHLRDGHLVLGQRSRLVRADDVTAACRRIRAKSQGRTGRRGAFSCAGVRVCVCVLSVSTMGSFLTMARFWTMRMTPSASVTVTTMGRPSGMAATARLRGTARR